MSYITGNTIRILREKMELHKKNLRNVFIETIDDEYSITMQHLMNKEHYVSFIAYITSGSVEIVKLYPEQDVSIRFRKKGHGLLYVYCNRHGLFRKNI